MIIMIMIVLHKTLPHNNFHLVRPKFEIDIVLAEVKSSSDITNPM